MKLSVFVILALFSCFMTAEEVDIKDVEFVSNFNEARMDVFYVDNKPYRMDKRGKLVPMDSYINIIGDTSLQEACKAGTSFDSSQATYDEESGDRYYTITNNADSEVIVVTTSADKRGMFCSTPHTRLQSGECLKVFEEDRLHTLAQVRVNGEVLCGGWKDGSPFCQLGNSYDIHNFWHPPLSKHHARYEMSPAEARTDCQ